MTSHDPQVDAAGILGVAIAKRTGERRIVTVEEYFRIDEASEARWEFFGFRDLDPETGSPSPVELLEFGFEPGGPTVIAGDLVEMEGGIFEPAVAVAADPQH